MGHDEYDDQDIGPEEHDGPASRYAYVDRCLFGPLVCVNPHLFHGPDECATAELMEAYEDELAGPDPDAACCDYGEDCVRDGEPHTPDACVYLQPFAHELGAGDA